MINHADAISKYADIRRAQSRINGCQRIPESLLSAISSHDNTERRSHPRVSERIAGWRSRLVRA